MKTIRYAVSVQHGSGHHFLAKTDLWHEEEADRAARVIAARYKRSYKKGARPLVHIWKRLGAFDPLALPDERSGELLPTSAERA